MRGFPLKLLAISLDCIHTRSCRKSRFNVGIVSFTNCCNSLLTARERKEINTIWNLVADLSYLPLLCRTYIHISSVGSLVGHVCLEAKIDNWTIWASSRASSGITSALWPKGKVKCPSTAQKHASNPPKEFTGCFFTVMMVYSSIEVTNH